MNGDVSGERERGAHAPMGGDAAFSGSSSGREDGVTSGQVNNFTGRHRERPARPCEASAVKISTFTAVAPRP